MKYSEAQIIRSRVYDGDMIVAYHKPTDRTVLMYADAISEHFYADTGVYYTETSYKIIDEYQVYYHPVSFKTMLPSGLFEFICFLE